MPTYHTLSRREFLKMVGVATSVVALEACAPQAFTEVAPTATPGAAHPTLDQVEPTPADIVLVEAGGFQMVLIEAGSFQMGSASGAANERPVHTVSITKPFYISKYAVTYKQYDEFCDDAHKSKPDDFEWGRGNRPVSVTWYDAVTYCNWLSEREGLAPCYSRGGKVIECAWPCYGAGGIVTQCDFSANGYRLPTEAEWEYAARGGQKSQGYVYAGSNDADDVAWYVDNSGAQTHPVGQKQANELGLHDMSGNAWEFCWDWFARDYYASSPSSDPRGPSMSSNQPGLRARRVRRGGDFGIWADCLRITYRSHESPWYPARATGFRIVRTGSVEG